VSNLGSSDVVNDSTVGQHLSMPMTCIMAPQPCTSARKRALEPRRGSKPLTLGMISASWFAAVHRGRPARVMLHCAGGFEVTYSNAPFGTASMFTKAVVFTTIWDLVLLLLTSATMEGGSASKAMVS